ncbi:hypothetical protein [Acinetobacter haemolyticus]|uniref:hypothetical protein n=1 Tax=Acinetobacter haemolyticus TaxID=29430 RepID=UPI000D691430|nr:hypothetical protein [Acinetobacter haemolyticus]
MKYLSPYLFNAIYIATVYWLINIVCSEFGYISGYGCDIGFKSSHVYHAFMAWFGGLFLNYKGKKPGDLILVFLYYFSLVPTILYLPKQVVGNDFIILVYSLYILFCFIFISYFNNKIKIKFPLVDIDYKWLIGFIYFLVVTCFFILIFNLGFTLTLPDITDVYGVRAEFKESSNIYVGYATMLGGYLFSPLLFILALKQSNKWLKVIFIFTSISLSYVIFTSSGLKSIAFSLFVVLFFYFSLRNINNFGYFFSIFLPSFIIINIVVFKLMGIKIVVLHWLRRVIVAPGSNGAKFFEYFVVYNNENTKYAPHLISEYYYNTIGSANSGFFGEAVGRFGWHGLIINSFILLLILIFSNSLTKYIGANILCALMILIGYALCNSSFYTVLLSYGFIPCILILYLFSYSGYLRKS